MCGIEVKQGTLFNNSEWNKVRTRHADPKGVTVGLMYVVMKRVSPYTWKNDTFLWDRIISCLF